MCFLCVWVRAANVMDKSTPPTSFFIRKKKKKTHNPEVQSKSGYNFFFSPLNLENRDHTWHLNQVSYLKAAEYQGMLWKGSQPTSCCLIGSSEIGNISFNLHCLKLESVFCFHIAEAFIKVNAMSDWMVRGCLFFPSVEDWRITTEDHSSEEEWRIIMKLPTARRFRINKWRWFLMPCVAKL